MTTVASQKKVFRAGIVGCGRIAGGFEKDPLRKGVVTHAGAYAKCASTQLVAVCDRDESKVAGFAGEWRVAGRYRGVEEMLAKENLDLLSICTWPESHFSIARKAVACGVKALFCEKPITDRLEDADALVELCKRENVLLAVNHGRRWDQGLGRIKTFFEEGRLGRISHVQAYYTAGIANTGTHLFDLLRFYLGEAQWVEANTQPIFGDKDPTLSGQILFENEVLATVIGLKVSDYLIFEFDFYGSKGRLRITDSGFGSQYWEIGKNKYFSGYQELTPARLGIDLKHKDLMTHAVSDLVACLQRGTQPRSTGEDGVKALEMICAFHESLKKTKRVELPLRNRCLQLPN